MKKIINGKLYDTDTAKEMGTGCASCSPRDFHYYSETLYRKRTGEYFLYGEGGPASRYAERVDNNMWSALSRYAIMCRPHLAEVIHPRKCDLDTIDLASVWSVCVGDPLPFAVTDWRQWEAVPA